MALRISRAGVALTVGIILVTGLIIGGLFWVKQTGEQARRDDAIAIAEQTLEQQSNTDTALNEGDEATSDEQAGNTETTAPSDDTSESTSTVIPGQATELPQTGASDIFPILVMGITVFVGLSYYRSRRTLLEAL